MSAAVMKAWDYAWPWLGTIAFVVALGLAGTTIGGL